MLIYTLWLSYRCGVRTKMHKQCWVRLPQTLTPQAGSGSWDLFPMMRSSAKYGTALLARPWTVVTNAVSSGKLGQTRNFIWPDTNAHYKTVLLLQCQHDFAKAVRMVLQIIMEQSSVKTAPSHCWLKLFWHISSPTENVSFSHSLYINVGQIFQLWWTWAILFF